MAFWLHLVQNLKIINHKDFQVLFRCLLYRHQWQWEWGQSTHSELLIPTKSPEIKDKQFKVSWVENITWDRRNVRYLGHPGWRSWPLVYIVLIIHNSSCVCVFDLWLMVTSGKNGLECCVTEAHILIFSARVTCPATIQDSAVTAARAPMCRNGPVAWTEVWNREECGGM